MERRLLPADETPNAGGPSNNDFIFSLRFFSCYSLGPKILSKVFQLLPQAVPIPPRGGVALSSNIPSGSYCSRDTPAFPGAIILTTSPISSAIWEVKPPYPPI